MPERDIFTPPEGPPGPMPGLEGIFSEWGEEGMRNLVSRFYDLIAESKIAAMFPEELTLAKQKQADFMIQVTGGPSLYLHNWGPARMRMRHFAFLINEESRQVWLSCYKQSLEEFSFSQESKAIFLKFLDQFSRWMVNQA
ncbi:putative globin [Leptospira ryugenii]|uniref:Putative globin n=1 Tax=Leptospira ryugenii TaxID=1917863 RepID=A0A2P2DZ38_9LEPT|nr:bacitracin resistance protein BacA [Leptospira ryugenii]GBF49883.1 putative globin [Leptospira ryugenii]